MLRTSAIALLVAMGLITNQLPLLWLSYSTTQSNYAIENCESPKTSCHGSCTMERDFVETAKTADDGGQSPVTVIESENNLLPYVVPYIGRCQLPSLSKLTYADRHISMSPQFLAVPTPPPPRS